MTKREIQRMEHTLEDGDRVRITGNASELWIHGCDCTEIDSDATVLVAPLRREKKVMVRIDHIGHKSNVVTYVRKSKVRKM